MSSQHSWRFHAQNLNDRADRTQGPMFRHGRCWWGPLSAEWSVFRSPRCGFSFGHDDEGRFTVSVRLILATLYLSCSVGRCARDEREFNVYVSDGSLWLSLWGYPMGKLHGRETWWQAMHVFHVKDWLLGRQRHSKTQLEQCDALVPMPEGAYPAKVTISRSVWKRPRWFARSMLAANVELVKPIPVEGKGENSWDCGEDAIYSMYTPARTVDEAVSKVVANVMRDRRRHGTPSRLRPALAVA